MLRGMSGPCGLTCARPGISRVMPIAVTTWPARRRHGHRHLRDPARPISRRSSGSKRVDSGVEPTRSQSIERRSQRRSQSIERRSQRRSEVRRPGWDCRPTVGLAPSSRLSSGSAGGPDRRPRCRAGRCGRRRPRRGAIRAGSPRPSAPRRAPRARRLHRPIRPTRRCETAWLSPTRNLAARGGNKDDAVGLASARRNSRRIASAFSTSTRASSAPTASANSPDETLRNRLASGAGFSAFRLFRSLFGGQFEKYRAIRTQAEVNPR
jgi:hypothetical protein